MEKVALLGVHDVHIYPVLAISQHRSSQLLRRHLLYTFGRSAGDIGYENQGYLVETTPTPLRDAPRNATLYFVFHKHNDPYSEFNTLCIPTLAASSLLSTYGLKFSLPTPANAPPPAPALKRSLSASGPITKRLPISARISSVEIKLASKGHDRSRSRYLVMSLVTINAPVALTCHFLKWSRSWLRKPMATSVKRMVRLVPSSALEARAWKETRNLYVESQVCSVVSRRQRISF